MSRKFLASTDLGGESVRDSVATMCVRIHTSVSDTSDRFYAELRRRYYTTPKSYLDLINLYLQLLREKREDYMEAKDRLLNGLFKVSASRVHFSGFEGGVEDETKLGVRVRVVLG